MKVKIPILILLFCLSGSNLFGQSLRDELYKCAIEEFHKRNYESAIIFYSRIIEISPNDSIVYLDRAMARECLGDFAGAARDYTKQLRVDSTNVDCYFLRGINRYKLKQYKAAISDFDHTLALEPDNADAWQYRGESKTALGRFKEAASDKEKAKKLNAAGNSSSGETK